MLKVVLGNSIIENSVDDRP